MKKRQVKKIVKKYGDSWWKLIDVTPQISLYYLSPPNKWRTKKILNEFHKRHKVENVYWYKISV